MREQVPYPPPSSAPLRELTARLQDGLLSPEQADALIAGEIPESIVALHVQDLGWWKNHVAPRGEPLRLRWKIESWQATLHFQTEGLDFWVDPGPDSPMPEQCPDLILITHAHHDHIGRLANVITRWPEARVLMTVDTECILREINLDLALHVSPRILRMEYNQPCTLYGTTICAYPAGHLLGAAMFAVRYETDTILISGDFALREVGGLPGGILPPGEYGLLALESSSPDRAELPLTDLASTHLALLEQIDDLVNSGKTSIVINAQSLGQAQEAYAALVTAQRAGAFPMLDVWMHGKAAKISDLYRARFANQSGVWSLEFPTASQLVVPKGIVITSISSEQISNLCGRNQQDSFAMLPHPAIYTHGSWAEHISLALLTRCHEVALYHGFSLSLTTALRELGINPVSMERNTDNE